MAEMINWTRFSESLCVHGPDLLTGIGEGTRELIASMGMTTDAFWWEGLQELLAEGEAEGDIRAGVLAALELWSEIVLQTLADNFAVELDWQTVKIDTTNPLINEQVEVASRPTGPRWR